MPSASSWSGARRELDEGSARQVAGAAVTPVRRCATRVPRTSLSRASARCASASVKRPARSALPATAASQPSVADRDQVVDRRDAAGRDHREPGAQDLGEELDVGSGERSVAGGARHEQPR